LIAANHERNISEGHRGPGEERLVGEVSQSASSRVSGVKKGAHRGGEDRVCVVSAGGLVVTSAVKRELGARACWISRTGRVGEC